MWMMRRMRRNEENGFNSLSMLTRLRRWEGHVLDSASDSRLRLHASLQRPYDTSKALWRWPVAVKVTHNSAGCGNEPSDHTVLPLTPSPPLSQHAGHFVMEFPTRNRTRFNCLTYHQRLIKTVALRHPKNWSLFSPTFFEPSFLDFCQKPPLWRHISEARHWLLAWEHRLLTRPVHKSLSLSLSLSISLSSLSLSLSLSLPPVITISRCYAIKFLHSFISRKFKGLH